ncbi:MAG TPA: hypothetical protein PLK30_02625 [Blastocatellia bacterium]|nr:hypothetical protein [Blastocatellia bacterium]
MKTSKKVTLGIIALALVVCFIVFRPETDEPDVTSSLGISQGPLFDVRVIKPRLARPLFGILPVKLEEKLEPGAELRFDQTSPGAKIGNIGPNRLDLSANDWALFIETDSGGKVTSGTHLVYTKMLVEKQRKLRCRPADTAIGYLRTTTRAGSGELDGRFLVELATCENIETGKVTEWPPAPLTVRGSFKGLPNGQR